MSIFQSMTEPSHVSSEVAKVCPKVNMASSTLGPKLTSKRRENNRVHGADIR
jgi:hypothetical protein